MYEKQCNDQSDQDKEGVSCTEERPPKLSKYYSVRRLGGWYWGYEDRMDRMVKIHA